MSSASNRHLCGSLSFRPVQNKFSVLQSVSSVSSPHFGERVHFGPCLNMNTVFSVSEWEFWGRGVVYVIAQAWGRTAAASCVAGEATRHGCATWRRSATAGSYGAVTSSAIRADTRRRNTSATRQEWISVQSGQGDPAKYT